MKNLERVKYLAAIVFAMCAGNVVAQRPLPPPPQPEALCEPNIDAWAETYDRLNYPRVLVLAGPYATTNPSGMFQAEEDGFATQFRSEFQRIINDPSVDLDLVDIEALRGVFGRLGGQLQVAGETEAIRMLQNELQFDLMIAIQFLDAENGLVPGRSRMNLVVTDVSSGRTLVQYAFDWKRGTDLPWIKRYANDLACIFTEEISRRPPTTAMEIRLFDFDGDPIASDEFKRTMEAIQGVRSVRGPRVGTAADPFDGELSTMHSFRVRYVGESSRLAADIARAQVAFDDRELRFVSQESAAISLRVLPKPPELSAGTSMAMLVDYAEPQPVEVCAEVITEEGEAGDLQRALIHQLYRDRDSPRFTVLVNRMATSAEREQADSEGSGGGLVSMRSSAPGDGDDFRLIHELELQARQLEQAVQDLLGPNLLNFSRTDPDVARARLADRMRREDQLFGQAEMVEILRDAQIADVVIFGFGTTRSASMGDARSTFTFKIVNLSDAAYLAGATVTDRLITQGDQRITERMAQSAIRQMACELIAEWSPPTQLEVTVKNLQDSEDANDIYSAINALAETERGVFSTSGPGEVFDAEDGGIFRLRVEYSCEFEELFEAFDELSTQLPFRLDIETLRTNEVTLNIIR